LRWRKEHGSDCGLGVGIAFLGSRHVVSPGRVVVLAHYGRVAGVHLGREGRIVGGCSRGRGWLRLGRELRRLVSFPGERTPGA
jgi:hypothetical protein